MVERKSFIQSVREGYRQEMDDQRLAAASSPYGLGLTNAMLFGLVIGFGIAIIIVLLLIWGLL